MQLYLRPKSDLGKDLTKVHRVKSRIISGFAALIIATAVINCTENQEIATRSYPVIDTKAVSDITATSATLNGEILNLGSSGVRDCGFVFDAATNPGIGYSNLISLGPFTNPGAIKAVADRDLAPGKLYYVRAYAVGKTNGIVVYGQQFSFSAQGSNPPTISDFNPKHASVGDTLVILGTAFSNGVLRNRVFFGNGEADVAKANADTIWCIVPLNAPIGDSDLTVTVAERTVKADAKFSLLPISITSIDKSQVTFGDTVTLTVSNLPHLKSAIIVHVFDKQAPVLSVHPPQMKITIPNDAATTTSQITIYAGLQTVSSAASVTLRVPVINSFTPASGPKNTVITISGNYFNPDLQNNVVQLGSNKLTLSLSTKTTIKASIPTSIAPGTYALTVSTVGQTATAASTFTVTP